MANLPKAGPMVLQFQCRTLDCQQAKSISGSHQHLFAVMNESRDLPRQRQSTDCSIVIFWIDLNKTNTRHRQQQTILNMGKRSDIRIHRTHRLIIQVQLPSFTVPVALSGIQHGIERMGCRYIESDGVNNLAAASQGAAMAQSVTNGDSGFKACGARRHSEGHLTGSRSKDITHGILYFNHRFDARVIRCGCLQIQHRTRHDSRRQPCQRRLRQQIAGSHADTYFRFTEVIIVVEVTPDSKLVGFLGTGARQFQ